MTSPSRRLLFLKHSLQWPRVRGHDVHTYALMKALGDMGHELNLFTVERPADAALAGLRTRSTVSSEVAERGEPVPLPWLQERFRSYWGVEGEDLTAFGALARQWQPDVIVATGPEALPYLAVSPRSSCRVWYAADDLSWQHLVQVRSLGRDAWANLRMAVINAAYERTFSRSFDRAWVVSDVDARAMHLIGGARRVDVIPNGVDTDYFRPRQQPGRPNSAIFWGNMSFEPNVRAVEWFCSTVWPIIRQRRPTARLSIAGSSPSQAVRHLSGKHGVEVLGQLEDIRDAIAEHAIAVMPFVSGAGLKNKMLEAAAMGRATICSPVALNGLRGAVEEAFVVVREPHEWVRRIEALWDDESARTTLGTRAREWVECHHTWRRAAGQAIAALQQP